MSGGTPMVSYRWQGRTKRTRFPSASVRENRARQTPLELGSQSPFCALAVAVDLDDGSVDHGDRTKVRGCDRPRAAGLRGPSAHRSRLYRERRRDQFCVRASSAVASATCTVDVASKTKGARLSLANRSLAHLGGKIALLCARCGKDTLPKESRDASGQQAPCANFKKRAHRPWLFKRTAENLPSSTQLGVTRRRVRR